ncbi:hypothetical protein ACTXGL_02470 [Psychrobacter sp. T6-6]|uniref:hypothetical protein n=1 Tax=Psychrobacter sp. T6-6 TaxID=3457452 RepID=UPI003FCEECC2
MNIYLSFTTILTIAFMSGLTVGVVVYRIITAPMRNKDRISLDEMRISLDRFEKRNRPPPPLPRSPNK